MKLPHARTLNRAFLLGLASIAFYAFILKPFGLTEPVNRLTHSHYFNLRHAIAAKPSLLKDLALVTIDDESIGKLHSKFPFKRRLHAEMIRNLHDAGAKVIALDLVFFGREDPADDFILAEAIQNTGNVVLGAFIEKEGKVILPKNDISLGSAGVGVVNKILDADLRIRRAPLYFEGMDGKPAIWPWEVVIASQVQGFNPADYIKKKGRVEFIRKDRSSLERVPLNGGKDTVLINYRIKPEDILQIPMWEVLHYKTDLESLVSGKIVLVGATSKAIQDFHSTPFGLLPGVVINANLLLSLLASDHLIPLGWFVDALFLGMFIFLTIWIAGFFDVARGLLLMLAVTLTAYLTSFVLFLFNIVTGPTLAVMGGWLAYLALTLYEAFHFWIENTRLMGEVTTDPLTRVYNRRFLESKMEEWVRGVEESKQKKEQRRTDQTLEVSFIMMDVDNFKHINDTYGHQFGDEVLITIAHCLQESVRKADVAARFGGEEFCVLLNQTGKAEAFQIAEKIRINMASREMRCGDATVRVTLSLGLASVEEDALQSPKALLGAADQALYEAKRAGKNRTISFQKPT